jgi:hypothetical protein
MRVRLAVVIASLAISAALPVSVLAIRDDTATDDLRVLISAPGHARAGATFTVTVRLVNTSNDPSRVQLVAVLPRFASPTQGSLVQTFQDPRMLVITGRCGESSCTLSYISLDDIDPGLTVLFRYEVTVVEPGPEGGATFAFQVNRFDSFVRASASKTVIVQESGSSKTQV